MVPDVGTFVNLGPFFTKEASVALVQPKWHLEKAQSWTQPASLENKTWHLEIGVGMQCASNEFSLFTFFVRS